MARQTSLCTGIAAAIVLALFPAEAKAKSTRFGFQKFSGSYKGGYAISVDETPVSAGEARIRIRAAGNGRSARVIWTNTFYTTRGSYKVALRWNFQPGGRLIANSIDARVRNLAATGTFALSGNRPIAFTATDSSGQATAEGRLKMIGGGALSITVTVRGLPDGTLTCTFSGGR